MRIIGHPIASSRQGKGFDLFATCWIKLDHLSCYCGVESAIWAKGQSLHSAYILDKGFDALIRYMIFQNIPILVRNEYAAAIWSQRHIAECPRYLRDGFIGIVGEIDKHLRIVNEDGRIWSAR